MVEFGSSWLEKFVRSTSGSIALKSGLLFATMTGGSLFAVDFYQATRANAAVQAAADAGAIASARQLPFILVDQSSGQQSSRSLTAIASGIVEDSLKAFDLDHNASAKIVEGSQVRVDVKAEYKSLFSHFTGVEKMGLSATATAESFGGDNICVVSIDTSKKRPGIEVLDNAKLLGENCGIYSNSGEQDSITAGGSAYIEASFLCSAGGYVGKDRNFSTGVTTDCPQVGDLLSDRPPLEPSGTCKATNLILEGGNHHLEAGTYCGGVTIRGTADVSLASGEYVFTKGPLIVEGDSRLRGTEVGLFFDDQKSFFEFKDRAEINIGAPLSGAMAGMLIGSRKLCGESTKCESVRRFSITSSRVTSLLGTLYIPLDEISIDTTMPVSSEAAFTIIVVGNMFLKQSPTLVLNTNYDATDVPVPAGFTGPQQIRIVQ